MLIFLSNNCAKIYIMAKKKTEERQFHHELIQQLITLSTSGFGLVAALAWNETVQTLVREYIQKYYPSQSTVLSKFIYALIITALAVLITYQLSRLAAHWEIKK